jgi:hypothetical protein
MHLDLESHQLKITLTPIERLWAVRIGKTITIPLTQIQQVSITAPSVNWKELRSPGTFVPGILKAGTFYQNSIRSFWYTKPKMPVLTLELSPDAYYRRIILSLNDNLTWYDRLKAMVK